MASSASLLGRTLRYAGPSWRLSLASRQPWLRYASHSSASPQKPAGGGGSRLLGLATLSAVTAAASYVYFYGPYGNAKDEALEDSDGARPGRSGDEYQPSRPLLQQPLSEEEARKLIESRYAQVRASRDHPALFAWGSNTGRVVDPDSAEKNIKLPRRIPFFDGKLLRDLKLGQDLGVAITETGDLVQWGVASSEAKPMPTRSLAGKDLIKVGISTDRIIALSRHGLVYSLPCSRLDQEQGQKLGQPASAWSLWSSAGEEAVSFRLLTPATLGRGEKVVDISSGLEHCLMLTSHGRVFAAASSTASFPSRGQMGIAGLSWETRPEGPYDQPHEITALRGSDIGQIATGDDHSVVLDKKGGIWSFGDNTFGQLGFETEDRATLSVSTPTRLSTDRLYEKTGLRPTVSSVAAGGRNTFFTVDGEAKAEGQARGRGPTMVADVWACGQGILGSLGTGKWTHVSPWPTKVKALSSLYAFDEKAKRRVPIRLRWLSIGATHSSAVVDSVTGTTRPVWDRDYEAGDWGLDVVFWGGNEHYQLGTGGRANADKPIHIGPLEAGGGVEGWRKRGDGPRLCLAPPSRIQMGIGGEARRGCRESRMEQRVACGRFVTGVYAAAV